MTLLLATGGGDSEDAHHKLVARRPVHPEATLRHKRTGHSARSAALFVGSTPSTVTYGYNAGSSKVVARQKTRNSLGLR
jgi:hypothetical protein